MITEKVKAVALALQKIGQGKIELAQLLTDHQLTPEEKDDLYCASIKDQLHLVFSSEQKIKPLELYLALQMNEIYSAENIYYAGQKFNHCPSEEEIRDYYISCDRPSRFREKFNEILSQYK